MLALFSFAFRYWKVVMIEVSDAYSVGFVYVIICKYSVNLIDSLIGK